jgi:hypothetical protein
MLINQHFLKILQFYVIHTNAEVQFEDRNLPSLT